MNTVPMQLPFAPMEWWRVVNGWNFGSHQGNAKFCWDFVKAKGSSSGAQLFCSASGTVVQIEPNGNWIYVKHASGENFAYLHITSNSWNVKEGDKVQMGQPIATVGDTGTSVGNFHLHVALSNIFDGTNPAFTTVESQFMDYDVSNDQGQTHTHVNVGIPVSGQWIRRRSRWSGWQRREEGVLIGAPTAISRKPTITDMFGRGLDNRLWQNSFVSGQGWGGWFRHEDGFILGSSPAIDSMQPDHLHIFACDSSGKVFQKWWPGVGGWSNWSPWKAREAGTLIGAPTAVSRKPTITDMFGRGSDNRLWQNSYVSGQGWGGWFRHEDGFILGSSPEIDSMHGDHLHIFACDSSGKVFQKWWPGVGGWSNWSPWSAREAGILIGAPTAVSRKPTITDMFGRGIDNRLWQNSYVSGQGWSGWFRHEDGFILGSSPVVDTMHQDHLHIFACDPSGKVFQKWWKGA